MPVPQHVGLRELDHGSRSGVVGTSCFRTWDELQGRQGYGHGGNRLVDDLEPLLGEPDDVSKMRQPVAPASEPSVAEPISRMRRDKPRPEADVFAFVADAGLEGEDSSVA